MQKEAEQRVREMQSRARLVGGEQSFPPAPKRNELPQKNPIQQDFARKPFPFFSENIDSDKIIILALLWLLWNEHADPKLLLALLYLLI